MPVTFDSDSVTPEYLEKYYRNGGGRARTECADYLRDPANRFRMSVLAAELERLSPERVLDAGCGNMSLEAFVPEKMEIEFTACDLATPQSTFGGAVFAVADAAALPFGNGVFDAAVCSEVLEHLFDPGAGLDEIRRVLRLGGYALITVPNWFSLDSIDGVTGLISGPLKFAARIGLSSKWRHGLNTHLTRMPPSQWRKMIEKCGFGIECERPVYVAPYIPYILKGLKKIEFRMFDNQKIFELWQKAEEKMLERFPFSRLGQFHYFRCKKK